MARTAVGEEVYVWTTKLGGSVDGAVLADLTPVQRKFFFEAYRYWKKKEEKQKEREAKKARR